MHETVTRAARLDSWKAIADYLGRDVATVRRWEKTLGLPVRRVPGGRGHSVFAYVSEIDAWLLAKRDAPAATDPVITAQVTAPEPSAVPQPVPAPDAGAAVPRRASRRWTIAAMLLLTAAIGTTWQFARAGSPGPIVSVQVAGDGIDALDDRGHTRWRFPFEAATQTVLPDERAQYPAEVIGGPDPGVLFARSYRIRTSDRQFVTGDLLWLSPQGRVVRSLALEDRIEFGGGTYGTPWGITDFRVAPGEPRRIALVAHHFQWWPGIVTILDGDLRRMGTFVNPGWLQNVQWVTRDRLLVSGFSNDRDGAILALIDVNAIAGQSPTVKPEFRCLTCGPGVPLRYVVMPRSELNQVTASPFNKVVMDVLANGFSAHTIEVPANAFAVDAVYDFSRTLDVVRATFSDRYWEMHRSLEAAGKIAHSREQCPDRDGPRAVEMWEPSTGWRTVPIRR